MLFIDIAKYFINYFAHFRKTRAHEERCAFYKSATMTFVEALQMTESINHGDSCP